MVGVVGPVGMVGPVVCDGSLGPPEVRRYHRLDMVYLLQDALVLARRQMGGRPTEDHHDSIVFLGKIVVVFMLSSAASC
jgi:hypothetical protein